MKARCYGCGLDCRSSKFQDLLVPNEVWELINPTRPRIKGAGLLCPNCIIERCYDLGLRNVPFIFASGPFAYDINLSRRITVRNLIIKTIAAWIRRLRYG